MQYFRAQCIDALTNAVLVIFFSCLSDGEQLDWNLSTVRISMLHYRHVILQYITHTTHTTCGFKIYKLYHNIIDAHKGLRPPH